MKRRILVVEDDAHLADGLRINLELEGYEPVLAGSAEEGLELWQRGRHRPDPAGRHAAGHGRLRLLPPGAATRATACPSCS